MLACKGIFTPCINGAGARQCAWGNAQRLARQDFLRILYHIFIKSQVLFDKNILRRGV